VTITENTNAATKSNTNVSQDRQHQRQSPGRSSIFAGQDWFRPS
jgi:flagellar basal body L-ring protein FlgH